MGGLDADVWSLAWAALAALAGLALVSAAAILRSGAERSEPDWLAGYDMLTPTQRPDPFGF